MREDRLPAGAPQRDRPIRQRDRPIRQRTAQTAHPLTPSALLVPLAIVLVLALASCASNTRAVRTSPTDTTRATSTTAADTSASETGGVSAPASGPSGESVPPPTPAPTAAGGNGSGDAAAALAALPVAPLNLAVPYQRTQDFGPAWADVDHNGCDTRNDILHRDLTAIEVRPGTHDCVVVAGTLRNPYTGTTIQFLKAQADKVQIDHVVPLHAAWELGAYQWPYLQRLAFANDPANLLAVDAHDNEVKGDSLADTWVPPNRGEWCDYSRRTIAVHAAYHLPATAAEKGALGRLLATCSNAAGGALPAPSPAAGGGAGPAPTPAPPPASTAAGDGVYYANCAAVRAAGKAPLHRGDPGYRSGLDRDNDGVACE